MFQFKKSISSSVIEKHSVVCCAFSVNLLRTNGVSIHCSGSLKLLAGIQNLYRQDDWVKLSQIFM